MIWSLVKILLFILAVTGLTYGAGELMNVSGGAVITVAGIEFTLTALELALGFIVIVGLVWLGLRLIGLLVAVFRFLNGDETAISRYFTRNRERRGFEALAEGMMALASGEGQLALAKAAKAERYLEKPELTTILTAQAAEMAGDTQEGRSDLQAAADRRPHPLCRYPRHHEAEAVRRRYRDGDEAGRKGAGAQATA